MEVVIEELAAGASQFSQSLRAQHHARLKGGLYHLNQIGMAYHSNRIEGGRLSEEQTRYMFDTQTVTGDAHVDDVIEMNNHFYAFDAMLGHAGTPITAGTFKHYHRMLKECTAQSRRAEFVVGDWKRAENSVGGRATTPPAAVDDAIDTLIERTPARLTLEDIVDFHVRFERIHPFQDGNGRVGRLVMFEQCLANDVLPFIVLNEQRADYYRGIAEYDDEPGYLLTTFRRFQEEYYDRYAAFVPPAMDINRPESPDNSG